MIFYIEVRKDEMILLKLRWKRKARNILKAFICLKQLYVSFLRNVINSTTADAYEYFAELRVNGNIFGENVYAMTKEKGRKIYKTYGNTPFHKNTGGADSVR